MQLILKRLLFALFLSAFVIPAQAVERYMAGAHYQIVGDVNAPKPDKPHVIEFFSYGCPHCEHLEHALIPWYEKHKDKIVFERVPAQWNPYFRELGRLYLTLDKLGLAQQHNGAVFEYIHKKRKSLRKQDEIFAFAEKELAIAPAVFKSAWESDDVKQALQRAGTMLRQYKVSGVPALLVNKRYYVGMKSVSSEEELFEVVNFLMSK